VSTLVCFAVKEEARHFRQTAAGRVLITGMGVTAAAAAFEQELRQTRPDLVLTCGFAGGLNADLRVGTVIFETTHRPITERLSRAGAIPVRFHCAAHVAVTRSEKADLRRTTQADAVEMESGIIRRQCAERGIPAATVRVISDAADEDLPIDFNQLITARGRLRLGGLIAQLLRRPGRIPALLELQRKTSAASRALGQCLETFVSQG